MFWFIKIYVLYSSIDNCLKSILPLSFYFKNWFWIFSSVTLYDFFKLLKRNCDICQDKFTTLSSNCYGYLLINIIFNIFIFSFLVNKIELAFDGYVYDIWSLVFFILITVHISSSQLSSNGWGLINQLNWFVFVFWYYRFMVM